jgi:allophanate hydrolase
MTWDDTAGSLDFNTLQSRYTTGALQPEDVIRIAARGEDHVWIHLVSEEEAIAAARRVASTMPKSAPLFGLPCAIKNNIDVPGLPSTSAFPPSRRIATHTGIAVQRLLDAGAIVIGKTNMDQLATAHPEPKPRSRRRRGGAGSQGRGQTTRSSLREPHLVSGERL